MGFEEEECLLPYPRRSFDGFRLFAGVFTFPEKFLFLNWEVFGSRLADFGSDAEILFYFSKFDPARGNQASKWSLGKHSSSGMHADH